MHVGSIFLPLPDGQALVYSLEGESLPPTPVALPLQSYKAKVSHGYQIQVANWLKDSQRFDVTNRLE